MIIKITIDRFEGDKAVLKTEDNQNIIWPKEKLPKDIKEGSNLVFVISNNHNDDGKKLAKNLLNELLDTSNS